MHELSATQDPMIDPQNAVLRLCPHWQGENLGPFDFLSGGYSNDNYAFTHEGERYVLRVPQGERPFVDRKLEQAFYRQAQQVRTVSVVAFDTDLGLMLSRWQEGPLLSDEPAGIDELVPYLQELHQGLPPSTRPYDPIALARGYLKVGSPPEFITTLANRLEWRPLETRSCHNDLNPWNIIRATRDAWVTLDWEWFGDNDPLFDLITLHQGLLLDAESLPDLAAAFLQETNPAARLRQCYTAFWLREYAWAHAELAHGSERQEISDQLNLALTRLRAL